MMKKIFLLSFLIAMCFYAHTQTKQPTLTELQKQLDNLPKEQKDMLKQMGIDNVSDMVKKAKSTNPDAKNNDGDSWEKAEQDRIKSIGTKTTKTIGAEGGVIVSSNGKITLRFPAGALSINTEINIEELESTAPLACGNAFKLTPEGQTFNKPVDLILKYSAYDIDGTVAEALAVSTEADGVWLADTRTKLDTATKTITLPIKHFSIWGTAAFLKMEMLPQGDRNLGRGQSIRFRITTYVDEAERKAKFDKEFAEKFEALDREFDENEEARKKEELLAKEEWNEYVESLGGESSDVIPLVKEAPKTRQRHIKEFDEQHSIKMLKDVREKNNQEEDLVPLVPLTEKYLQEKRLGELLQRLNKFKGFKLTSWKMNGDIAPVSNDMGNLYVSEYGSAVYTAPMVVPLNNIRSVAVSCELTHPGSHAKFMFVSHVRLVNNGWFTANIDGKAWSARQLMDQEFINSLQGTTKLTTSPNQTQLTPNQNQMIGNIKSADANYFPEGEEKGLWLSLTDGYPKTLIIHIADPHVGENNIDCNIEGTVIYGDKWAAKLLNIQRTPNGTDCITTEHCEHMTIHLTSLNLKTGGLVSGYFSGSLYGGEIQQGSTKKCISDTRYKISGKFSLSVVRAPAATEAAEKVKEQE